ncbi:MAG: heavy-metal-associated domain-containing protein [Gemmatimonadales bacterium]
MASVRIDVSGMTCDHCRGRVEAALKAVEGVYAVFVDLDGGFAEVDFDDKRADPDSLAGAVTETGYGAKVVCP